MDKLVAAKPAPRSSTPFPVAAIIDELRKTSGDDAYARVWTSPPAPPALDAGPAAAALVDNPRAADAGPATPAVALDDAGDAPETQPVTPEPVPSPIDETPPMIVIDDIPSPFDLPPDDGSDDGGFSANARRSRARRAAASAVPDPMAPAPGSWEAYQLARRKQADALRSAADRQRRDWQVAAQAQKDRWQAELRAQKARWLADRARFLKSLPQYRSHLTKIMAAREPVIPRAARTDVPKDVSPDAFVLVNGATEVPIHDQANRGTCAAFAGVRALEVVARGNGRELNLSEQFFYWLSRPSCQSTPCDTGGSWVSTAYAANLQATDFVIPESQACPYNPDTVDGNDTQIPLASRCSEGAVLRLARVTPAWSLPDILLTLDAGQPVVVASRLSENFFKSTGIVTEADAASEATRDSIHADGHAYLAVGYLALPLAMQAAEGRVCLLVANSWGEGWGAGGYACVTEAWFNNRRFDQDFLAPSEVWVK